MRLARALPLAGGVWLAAAAAAGGVTLTAADAVRETLARDPKVAQALAQVAERRGQNLEFTGSFDGTAFVDAKVDYQRQALAGEVLKDERKRRIQLDLVDRFFSNAARDLELRLREQNALSDVNSLLFGRSEQRQGATAGFPRPRSGSTSAPTSRGIPRARSSSAWTPPTTSGRCGRSAPTSSAPTSARPTRSAPSKCDISLASLRTLLFFANLEILGTPLETMAHESRALLEDQARIALRLVRLVADGARYARARLGGLPDEHELIDFTTQLGYRQRLRNGIGITPALEFRATEENFAGKLRIVAFGDSEKSNLFSSTARLTFDLPLGKNRGMTSVRAPELASAENLRAARRSRCRPRRTRRSRPCASTGSWPRRRSGWRRSSARWRLKVRIDEAVGALIDAQEMPGVERLRSRAQVAQTQSQLAGARQQAVNARAELARAIGLEGEKAGSTG